MKISGNTHLITGGGSGIGFELAAQLTALQNMRGRRRVDVPSVTSNTKPDRYALHLRLALITAFGSLGGVQASRSSRGRQGLQSLPSGVGATVTLIDNDTGNEKVCQIVGKPEADANKGRISVISNLMISPESFANRARFDRQG